MDSCSEATKVLLSRIKKLDPENVSKIMGYILIHHHSDEEMIRLAFGPESLLISHINHANSSSSSSSSFLYHNQYPFSSSSFYPNHNNHSNITTIDDHLLRPCVYFARGFCKNGATCSFLHHPYTTLDFFTQNLRHEFGHNSSSRQIYLTFPADSTFKEEDVSNYFNTYGPVQDVRIPFQQKRMFGFVTFVYPETVKMILAKGNPHFVCDSRVLVKPYKEKGKVPDKKQHHFDPRQHVGNLHEETRLFEMMLLRQKLEADQKHAIQLQSHRIAMNLQLMDLKIQSHYHHFPPRLRAPVSSPRQPWFPFNPEDLDAESPVNRNSALENVNGGHLNLPESLDDILPHDLVPSPTKSATECYSAFSN